MNAKLASCALGMNIIGWVAVANERLGLLPTSFAHLYAYAIAVGVLFAAAIIFIGKAFQDVIKNRPSDWHVVVFSTVSRVTRYSFLTLAIGAIAYVVFSVGGSASASTWESAGPGLRSAMFAGVSIFAAMSWIALSATEKAAA